MINKIDKWNTKRYMTGSVWRDKKRESIFFKFKEERVEINNNKNKEEPLSLDILLQVLSDTEILITFTRLKNNKLMSFLNNTQFQLIYTE